MNEYALELLTPKAKAPRNLRQRLAGWLAFELMINGQRFRYVASGGVIPGVVGAIFGYAAYVRHVDTRANAPALMLLFGIAFAFVGWMFNSVKVTFGGKIKRQYGELRPHLWVGAFMPGQAAGVGVVFVVFFYLVGVVLAPALFLWSIALGVVNLVGAPFGVRRRLQAASLTSVSPSVAPNA